MNKWVKFPSIFGIVGAVLGIFLHPIKILNINLTSQNLTTIFSLGSMVDGLLLGILLGLIIAFFIKKTY